MSSTKKSKSKTTTHKILDSAPILLKIRNFYHYNLYIGCRSTYIIITPNKTPTNDICAEKIFNSFVWFKNEKIYLSSKVPTIVAIFLLLIMPPEIKIIYDMSETTCSCGGKLHKHEIKQWKMNKIFPIYKQRIQMPIMPKKPSPHH